MPSLYPDGARWESIAFCAASGGGNFRQVGAWVGREQGSNPLMRDQTGPIIADQRTRQRGVLQRKAAPIMHDQAAQGRNLQRR